MVLGGPRRAFQSMPVGGGLGRPLLFAVIIAWIAVLANTFWDLLLRDWIGAMLPEEAGRWTEMSGVVRIVTAMLAPIWVTVAILVGAALQHLFLFLVSGAARGFEATFRVMCYASAPMILGVVPVCGRLIGVVWGLVLTIVGLAIAHRIGAGRATFAVLLPILLCCSCVALAIAMFGAALVSAIGRP